MTTTTRRRRVDIVKTTRGERVEIVAAARPPWFELPDRIGLALTPVMVGGAIGAALLIRHYVTSPDAQFVIATAGLGGVLVACLVITYLGALLGLVGVEGSK